MSAGAPTVWIPLLIQLMFAITGIELWRRWVLPSIDRLQFPALVLDVWGPVALMLPMAIQVRHIGNDVSTPLSGGGAGWLVIGGPIACGMLGLATALLVGQRDRTGSGAALLDVAILAGTGLVLLLLSAATVLSIWSGQCCFALAAVVLWLKTPEPQAARQQVAAGDCQAAHRTGWAMVAILACAVGHGWAATEAPVAYRPIAGALMLGTTAAMLAATARFVRGEAAMRIGGGALVYGVLFGLGLLSLKVLLPQALQIARGESVEPLVSVARGFGTFAWEGVVTLMVAGVVLAMGHWPVRVRVIIGGLLLLGTAILISARLAR